MSNTPWLLRVIQNGKVIAEYDVVSFGMTNSKEQGWSGGPFTTKHSIIEMTMPPQEWALKPAPAPAAKMTPFERTVIENQKSMFQVLRLLAWGRHDKVAQVAQESMSELHDLLNEDSMK